MVIRPQVCTYSQLHAIQEMWDLMPEEESIVDEGLPLFFYTDSAQLCLCVSEVAVSGNDSPKSMDVGADLGDGHTNVSRFWQF
jgi:hypothetical protein